MGNRIRDLDRKITDFYLYLCPRNNTIQNNGIN